MAPSSTNQQQPGSLVTSSTNPNVVTTVRQTASSKDDASIASGSSGCGSLTKKKSQGLLTGEKLPLINYLFINCS